jgi:hypothetical protein
MKPLFTVLLLLIPTAAFATPTCQPGDFLGYFLGNDDAASVSAALGINATLLGKVDDPPGSTGTFIVDVTVWDQIDPLAGTWQWQGFTPANLLTMKANGGWAAYCLGPQSGTWDTRLHLEGKGLSHASVWSVDYIHAPEPTTLILCVLALVCICLAYSGERTHDER